MVSRSVSRSIKTCRTTTNHTNTTTTHPNFYYWMTFTNFISSIIVTSFLFSTLSTEHAILISYSVDVCKFALEISYQECDVALLCHHIVELIGVYVVSWPSYRSYRWVFLHFQLIHVPLIFGNLKKTPLIRGQPTKSGQKRTVQYIWVNRLWMMTWASAALYRTSYMSYRAIQGLLLHGTSHVPSLWVALYSLVFFMLDVSWTPWHRYYALAQRVGKWRRQCLR